MRELVALALVATMGLLSQAGCGGGSGDYQERAAAKLRACGLLTAGRFRTIEEPQTVEARCEFNCMLSASCDTLDLLVCSWSYTDQLSACIARCYQSVTLVPCPDGSGSLYESEFCDGYDDCTDGSDEEGCTYFECADGFSTVGEAYVCDNVADCPDASDESGCPNAELWQCADGGTIPVFLDCDGELDCADGSDEQGCAEFICN